MALGLISGGMSPVAIDSVLPEYGQYLLPNEQVQQAFRLRKNLLLITTSRLFIADNVEGMKKQRIHSIYLNTIVGVEVETAGVGMDDLELKIFYFRPYHRYNKGKSLEFYHQVLNFEKSVPIGPLYVNFVQLSEQNCQKFETQYNASSTSH